MLIKNNSTVLFQGDSITDCGRIKENDGHLGKGYVMMISLWFNTVYPELNIKFINKGISGDSVIDLKDRWEKDCLDFNPDAVSILIGINDCCNRYESNNPTSVEEFRKNYYDILSQVKKKVIQELFLVSRFYYRYVKSRKSGEMTLTPKLML